MRIIQEGSRLAIYGGSTQLWIDPWGTDGVRVRMTNEPQMDPRDWALTEPVEAITPVITWEEVDTTDPWYKSEEYAHYHQTGRIWTFTNGKLTVKVNPEGWLSFYNQKGELLTEEYWRNRNRINRYSVSLRIPARELKCIPGTNDFALSARFEAFDDEMIFGMGQYQDKHLNKKGATLELCHRNCQASVPFYVSSRGYGFLWNNPAVGTCTFGTNRTEWTARSTKKMDYYITCGDTPADIERNYTAVTGRTPMMPEYGLGYWQCKLRYRTQDELMAVARKHKAMGLPLDVIVVDFFHWTKMGEWKFDPQFWPDPVGMVLEEHRRADGLLIHGGKPLTGKFGDYTFDEKGQVVISIAHGKSFTIPDLPEGTKYTVSEDSDGYIQTAPADKEVTGTITTGENKVDFVNERNVVRLVKVTDPDSLTVAPNVTVTGDDGSTATVALTANDEASYLEIAVKPGVTYTVAETGTDIPGGHSVCTVRFEVKNVAELDMIRNKLLNIRDVVGSRRGQN